VLITWGTRDLTAPKRWGKAAAAAIPGSRFQSFSAGHVVFSSQPEAWLATVVPFVDSAHNGGREEHENNGGGREEHYNNNSGREEHDNSGMSPGVDRHN
jgi:hypothetical protein